MDFLLPKFAPSLFADCVNRPYWWDDVPRPNRELDPAPLPARADLVVIGSGYTGISAAIEAVKGGLSVLVLDSEDLGFGCSTKNGGQVAPGLKPSLNELSGLYGPDLAARILGEGQAALAHARAVASVPGADCGWQPTGLYYAAHTPKQYELMEREAEETARGGGIVPILVPRARQHEELAADRYHGGSIHPEHALVHPAKLHAQLMRQAEALGVMFRGHTPALDIEADGRGFVIATARGKIGARKVLLATNGYTGALSPWHKRRVIPIGSYILATEELPADFVRTLIPNNRAVTDSHNVVIYFRASPDGRRILFGGRSALAETDPMRSLPRLYQMMLRVFPQLKGTRVTHSWMGKVAFTFDELPHLGTQRGVHYCMGYCGSGIALSTYFGTRIGQQILGLSDGRTALDGVRFQTRPLYNGYPWFLAPAILYYKTIDRYFA